MKLKHHLHVTSIAVLATCLASCGLDIPKEVPSSYPTITVADSNVIVPIKFSAKMKGQSDVTIMPQVSGQLTRICVSEGQRVEKGTTLFVIDQRNARLELEAAEANLQAALAQENSAQLEYESNKNLFEKNIVSRYMLDNSENSYKQAKAAASQARASVNRAKVMLGFCTITAPVTGLVGSISVHAGDQVTPATHLTIVSGNSVMEAEFSVTESLIEASVKSGVEQGEKEEIIKKLPDVTFLMKNGTEYQYKGRVTSITGVVDATTGSLACKAIFPNPEGHLFSGIQGTVVIPFMKSDVIVIPQNAVVRLQDKSLVYKVLPDSTVEAVSVTTTNMDNGKDAIVLEGLKAGDRIVTEGANNVQEGQRVLFPEPTSDKKKS